MGKNSQQPSNPQKAEITGEMLKSRENSTRALGKDLGSSANFPQSNTDPELKPHDEKQMNPESPKETFLESSTKAKPVEEDARKNDASANFLSVITDRLKNM